MAEKKPSLRELLDGLRADGLLDDAGRAAAGRHLAKIAEKAPLPWFIRGLIGAGAWLAAGFFVAFMGVADLIESGASQLGWGLAWIAAAVAIQWYTRNIFLSQMALAMSIAGHGMALVGVMDMVHDYPLPLAVVLTAAALCAALYPLYRTRTHRFLSCCMALGLVLTWLCEQEAHFALHGLVLVAAVTTSWILTRRSHPALRPLAQAAALAVPVTLLVMTVGDYIETPLWPSSIILAAGLIWVYGWAAGGPARLRSEPMIIAVVATVVLAGFTNPGILAAVGLMVLGHALADRFLLALSIASLPTFILFYYYDLQIGLAYKSWVLAGSGLLLLAVRFWVSRRPWARESAS